MVEAMRVFGTAVLGRESYGRLSPERLEQIRANSIEAEFLGSGFPALDAGAVRRIRPPTLLVGGRHSPRVFARLLDRLEELRPHAQRIEIPEASHIVHEDNAPAFNAAVASFLAAHRAAGPADAPRRGGAPT
jgi:pimeloyl-ACP methyl ester carboxylesterase